MSPPKEEETKSGSPTKKQKQSTDGNEMLNSEKSKAEIYNRPSQRVNTM